MCVTPRGYGTPDGVVIPPRGVLHRFDGKRTTPAPYDAGGKLLYGRFVVDPHWKAPVDRPRVVSFWHGTSDFVCAAQNTVVIELDQIVSAVRVAWASKDRSGEILVAPHPAYPRKGRPKQLLELGRLSCAGENLPVAALRDGVTLQLTAIRHDGSEIAIEGVPAFVDLDEVAAPVRPKQVAIRPSREPSGALPMQRNREDRTVPFLAAMGMAALAGWRLRRRRRCVVP